LTCRQFTNTAPGGRPSLRGIARALLGKRLPGRRFDGIFCDRRGTHKTQARTQHHPEGRERSRFSEEQIVEGAASLRKAVRGSCTVGLWSGGFRAAAKRMPDRASARVDLCRALDDRGAADRLQSARADHSLGHLTPKELADQRQATRIVEEVVVLVESCVVTGPASQETVAMAPLTSGVHLPRVRPACAIRRGGQTAADAKLHNGRQRCIQGDGSPSHWFRS
jgi:hypothetical protein